MGKQELNAKFVAAAKDNNTVSLTYLLAEGADIDGYSERFTALIQAVSKGHAETVRWLLDHGANVDGAALESKWTPLMFAAANANRAIAAILIEHGARLDARNKDGRTPAEVAAEKEKPDMAVFLRNHENRDPREISYTYTMQDRVLQEIFNFDRRERISLVRKSDGGTVEAMQRDSFSALDDTSNLRRAFDEHKKRGGKLTEGEVFGSVLQKTKLSKPAAPQP